jgi:hypothetical protein
MWQTWGLEAHLAARRLLRAPVFTAAVIATLGLAVGATTAMFAVVNRVVLSPLPYRDSDRLLMLQSRVPRAVAPPITAVCTFSTPSARVPSTGWPRTAPKSVPSRAMGSRSA